ncbi:MAG: hypothetical protein K2X77_08950 [Candidatus Obscuribacterales bacterium]|jgi:sugar lactone lactonase YvrE|nr:hypothetical protein [Candidatus Obscuribacterales bacterium]
MNSKLVSIIAISGFLSSSSAALADKPPVGAKKRAPTIMQIAKSSKQWTGITVSKTGRVFVCYPRWSDDVPVSVAELMPDGSTRAFPDKKWNQYNKSKPADCFVCVQSVFADKDDNLWILDPAAPKFQGPVKDGAKLLKVDLTTGKVLSTFKFNNQICPKGSYLNDLRVDSANNKIYITESGLGAIIVLDLKTSTSKRLLDKHPSTIAENIPVVINGKPWTKKVASDGIAFDGDYLYYKALTGKSLYRVPAKELSLDDATNDSIAKVVEKIADTCPSDGIEFGDDEDNLFITSIEDNSIKRLNLKDKKMSVVVQDKNMIWPDTLSKAANGWMYVTSSQINLMPKPPSPYRVFKFKYSN